MGIIENANIIKTEFGKIKTAIGDKGITIADGTPIGEYASLIESISGTSADGRADVFNHNGMVGLNPMYYAYSANSASSSDKWKITDEKMYCTSSTNSNIIFYCPISKQSYKKICFDCEIVDGDDSGYNIVTLGVNYCENGMITNRSTYPNAYIKLTDSANQTNYDNTEPWYNLPRQTVEFDISQLEDKPFYLMFLSIGCTPNIYSIWFE